VPRLWNDTIEAHRRAVRDAAIDAAASLLAERGLRGVTMSDIAARTGIGRATLYKYFPHVDSILRDWHDRQIGAHLAQLRHVLDESHGSGGRLEAVLQAYADIRHGLHRHDDGDLRAFLHSDAQVSHAERTVRSLFTDVLATAAQSGEVRSDVAPAELAAFAVHALEAADALPSAAAVRRLVRVTLAALRP
jgi:AcrR family transcriptional regulator